MYMPSLPSFSPSPIFLHHTVYVTTAANSRESSYACYLDLHLGTYLGDCYSVNWMEDVDQVGIYITTPFKTPL